MSDAGLRANFLSVAYRPAYDGALWLSQAAGSATPSAYVSWDRKGGLDQNLSIAASGVTLTPAGVAGVMAIDVSYGESLSVGGNATVAAGVLDTIAKSAVDAGTALMPAFADALSYPQVLSRQFAGTSMDLLELAPFGSSGGSHLPGLAKVSGTLQAARGAKMQTLYANAGASGARMFQLSQQGVTPYFANLARTIRNMLAIAASAGRQPVPKPVKWLQGANDSGSGQGLRAADYVIWLKRLLEDINMVWRQFGAWHPAAPDIPMLMIQPDREGVSQRSGVGGNPGGARVYKLGADGPRIGMWNAALSDPRLMLAGSHYQFPMSTVAGDNGSHLAAESYWRAGEMMAIAEDALMFGPRWRPLMPLNITLVSSTVIDVQTNSFVDFGQALSIDTVRVADMADAGKGFAVWNNASGTAYVIASVAVSGANSDTVRLTLGSAIAATDQPWIDYAVWRDDAFAGNAGPGSPGGTRGNIRLATGWASTVDAPLGRAAGTTVDYHWMVGARVPAPTTSGQIWPVDRRIA